MVFIGNRLAPGVFADDGADRDLSSARSNAQLRLFAVFFLRLRGFLERPLNRDGTAGTFDAFAFP
jgi:hypothetical protein